MSGSVSSVVELLERRASEQPDRLSYCFLSNGELESERLTYGELRQQSRRVAAHLVELKAQDERAVLLYPPGLSFATAFLGALEARVIAAPALPPAPRGPASSLQRVRAVAKDCGAKFVLTTSALLAAKPLFVASAPELGELVWVATDELPETDHRFEAPSLDENTIALLQYTSGSTALPRGVMVSHGNLLHNSGLVQRAFEQHDECVLVTWLPMYHDMGLIGCLLQPLYSGYPDYLMSPLDFLKHPVRWLSAISKYRATISGGPNFAYELCVRKITEQQSAGLDLSSWKIAFCGAEPVHADTVRRFSERFAASAFQPASFYPCYGLAEATLIVTGGPKSASPTLAAFDHEALSENRVEAAQSGRDSRTLVACGPVDGGLELLIVDVEQCMPAEHDRVGEIWVRGKSVAQGYYGQPAKTAETFAAMTADGRGPYLRTGDLGFVREGKLFICGRIKDLILVAGKNHYPQDIEQTVHAALPELRVGGVAAFSIEKERQEHVVLVVEWAAKDWKSPTREKEMTSTIREAVFREHQLGVLDIVLSPPGTIPKTSSGKLERLTCRKNYLARTLRRSARPN